MPTSDPSSHFTKALSEAKPFGPPLIGALLRLPWEAVQRHMLERLPEVRLVLVGRGEHRPAVETLVRELGLDDFDAAYLNIFQYPGPQGARPSELAARLRMTKQAVNYLLGELERLGYLERRPDPDDLRSKRVALTPRGTSAIRVIREAVGEMESTWAQQLGPKRFAQLRNLLLDLNQPA